MNDGGPAFPFCPPPDYSVRHSPEDDGTVVTDFHQHEPSDGGEFVPDYGMSLRDWFAGQALAGLTADPERFDKDFGNSSIICYRYADAMLAQREKR